MTKFLPKLLLIDSHALIYRAYHALPPLTTPQGEPVGAVYGFVSILLKVLKEIKPDYIVAAFDREEATFRHEKFKDYKATRPATPDDLSSQFPVVKEVLKAWGIKFFEEKGFEADDIIGTIVKKLSKEDIEIFILSGDLDTLQLVSEKVKVITPKRGPSETVIYDIEKVKERFGGLKPYQMTDYKSLVGDASDNIPGVPGIGPKTAIQLLSNFISVENIIKAVIKSDAKLNQRLRDKFTSFQDQVVLSKHLATINQQVTFDFSVESTQAPIGGSPVLISLFKDLGFYSLLGRLQNDSAGGHPVESASKETQALLVTPEQFSEKETKILGVFFDEESKKLFFVSGSEAREVFFPLSDSDKQLLLDENIKKICHDIKFIMSITDLHHIRGEWFDTKLASWLINSGERDYSFSKILFTHLSIDPGISFLSKVTQYSNLKNELEEKMRSDNLEKLFHEIELPLVPILFRMEKVGILIDKSKLKHLSEQVEEQIKAKENEIWGLAGKQFNINSTRELSAVIFGELKLNLGTKLKKTPKGQISTRATELEKLRGKNKIIDSILGYRELFKIKSTYLDAFPELVSSDGRLHTTFNQTGTITGRLSSSDPNLQNIPLHSSLGREIRSVFVATPGAILASFDYSQIHLRIIASLSEDEKMIDAFSHGVDIHRFTAAKVNNCLLDQVTPQMRSAAKALNFGIVYGMGVNSFAESAGISKDQAKNFIEDYFREFSAVGNFLEETREKAVESGFSETLLGRRRNFPDIWSSSPLVRAQAERMAVNFPIQGLEADIMKKAMIDVDNFIKERKLDYFKMILQVHDQLLFEVPRSSDPITQQVKNIMENVISLRVPLVVDLKVGQSWGEL